MSEPLGASDLHVRCQHCRERAIYRAPFMFVKSTDGHDLSHVHSWGKSLVLERFPSLMPFDPKAKSFSYYERGVVQCESCYRVYVTDLKLPDDLYYRWTIRGKVLYALHRAHAVELRAYIESAERDVEKFQYAGWLKRIPAIFLAAKNRDEVSKRITDSLKDG